MECLDEVLSVLHLDHEGNVDLACALGEHFRSDAREGEGEGEREKGKRGEEEGKVK